jgi:hypothetical protein
VIGALPAQPRRGGQREGTEGTWVDDHGVVGHVPVAAPGEGEGERGLAGLGAPAEGHYAAARHVNAAAVQHLEPVGLQRHRQDGAEVEVLDDPGWSFGIGHHLHVGAQDVSGPAREPERAHAAYVHPVVVARRGAARHQLALAVQEAGHPRRPALEARQVTRVRLERPRHHAAASTLVGVRLGHRRCRQFRHRGGWSSAPQGQ